MDLESMKETWLKMSEELEKQKKLTNEIILKMAHERSSSRLNRIIYMELIGCGIALLVLIYILFNFHRLDNWLTISGGVGTAVIMIAAVIMSVNIMRKAKKINILKTTYGKVISDFNDLTKTLGIYKRASIGLNIIMPFLLMPPMAQLLAGKDLLTDLEEFKETLIMTFILIPPMLYFIIRYYTRSMSKVRQAINELKEDDE